MKRYGIFQMYYDFFANLRLKNSLVAVFALKLLFIWALFHFLYDDPYKTSPQTAPSAIAEKLSPPK
ncbi:MAG: hypothetical protein AB7U44_11250 [Sulfuricurvum sp.]|uniref:hypothetical protein n=1 Tax=Sulfuricurvum sp. TaxID=2025608 RepID=UPI00262931D8|nr:hypothetical protein [Sulfuricurvum sp.]MDD2839472.1 hypothetical protein [Sulfuricurvum sp.]MDD3597255.1 hypothetical protein [Sulfuricurvum sp.]MDD4885213.1 hypothetical protein [Sulfuricurvum sp.]